MGSSPPVRQPGSAKLSGLQKWLFAAPKWIFKARLGFLFGKRFGLLEHIGRSSARKYETPLEIVTHRGGRYVICAGFGPESDWYQNLQANAASGLWIGSTRYEVDQEMLTIEQGAKELGEYRARHPKGAKTLWAMMGLSPEISDVDAATALPTVALTVR